VPSQAGQVLLCAELLFSGPLGSFSVALWLTRLTAGSRSRFDGEIGTDWSMLAGSAALGAARASAGVRSMVN
jgi:hypothetical protein